MQDAANAEDRSKRLPPVRRAPSESGSESGLTKTNATRTLLSKLTELIVVPDPKEIPSALVVQPEGTGTTLVVPEGYPLRRAPAEDMRRLLGAVRPPRPAPLTRRQRLNELGRIRDSFSQMWFICVLTLAALAVPAGLVIAPLIRLRLDVASGDPDHASEFSTPDPWVDVPRKCLREARVNDVIKELHVRDPAPLPLGSRHRGDVICLFNNSRFRKQLRWDYVPSMMPLKFCQCLLYWSVAVSEGLVRDRTPEFDVNYGVWKLKSLASSLASSYELPELMIALGGYREDSAHFSRLGRDSALMSRFAASVAKFLFKHDIFGALVDWKDIGGHCGSREDAKTLLRFLQRLQSLFTINKARYWVGAMLPAVKRVALEVTKAISSTADIIVYETHDAPDYDVFRGCTKATDLVALFMADMAAAIRWSRRPPRLCISLSVGVWSTLAYDFDGESVRIPDSGFHKISQRTGMAAVYEMCAALASSSVVQNYSLPGCVLYNMRGVSVARKEVVVGSKTIPVGTLIDRIFVYEDKAEIKRQVNTTATLKSSFCTTLYDLDFDNFRGVCEYRPLPNHFKLLHIDGALI
ncbi:hypothetical protein V5799_000102 [Amblyomma americanum]|uniref:GH18 domain-containing protein n=1 Tax=Amblyomma americanum TaxID=6943 RepID=A0AAQ4D409_AMBAM